ncbi:MAG: HAD-IB family hydrolase [Chloroflexi bacterium]|nr:HAD-IB family hydrolase [Chloroflexota bacterium]
MNADFVGAFFDMDYTVLRGSSGMLYLRYLLQTRRLTWPHWAGIVSQIGLYAVGISDFPHVMGRLMAQVNRYGETEAWQISAEWFEAMLRHYITDRARERIAWHRQQDHRPVLISAATPYAVKPVAEALGLGDAYLATTLEVTGGRFTGRLDEVCYGSGKVVMAREYAAAHGLNLDRSYFYSDSHEDLPLLEAVGHPVAVNPNRRLARVAAERSWPVMRF